MPALYMDARIKLGLSGFCKKPPTAYAISAAPKNYTLPLQSKDLYSSSLNIRSLSCHYSPQISFHSLLAQSTIQLKSIYLVAIPLKAILNLNSLLLSYCLQCMTEISLAIPSWNVKCFKHFKSGWCWGLNPRPHRR